MNTARAILELVLAPADRVLASLPLGTARIATLVLLILPVLVVLLLPRSSIFRGATNQTWTRDLRLWAVVFTIPYAVVYFLAG